MPESAQKHGQHEVDIGIESAPKGWNKLVKHQEYQNNSGKQVGNQGRSCRQSKPKESCKNEQVVATYPLRLPPKGM